MFSRLSPNVKNDFFLFFLFSKKPPPMTSTRQVYQKDPSNQLSLVHIPQLVNGEFYYLDQLITNPDEIHHSLEQRINWQQGQVKVMGKVHNEGRLTSMFSLDTNKTYSYSGKVNTLNSFTDFPDLDYLRKDLSRICFGDSGVEFNTLLCNWYRTGDDSIGMHSDSEQSLVPNMPIASISLGAERHFDIDPKQSGEPRFRIELSNGSLLIMGNNTQQNYKHGVPVQKRIKTSRVNLTFRVAK